MVLNWFQKHLRYADQLKSAYLENFEHLLWILRVFFLVFTNLMMHGFRDTRFFPGTKNYVAQGLTVNELKTIKKSEIF